MADFSCVVTGRPEIVGEDCRICGEPLTALIADHRIMAAGEALCSVCLWPHYLLAGPLDGRWWYPMAGPELVELRSTSSKQR